MLFKVFGKTSDKFSKWLCNETVAMIRKSTNGVGDIQFFDMDKPLGKQMSLEENIYYVPTVICENDEELELGYLENNSSYNPDIVGIEHDINLSGKWWVDLKQFIGEVVEAN